MTDQPLLDWFPLWAVFAMTVAAVLLSLESGFRIGRRRASKGGQEPNAPIGSVVGATLGLLAFLLAFAFGMAGNRFDARKQLLLDEVNAIGTAFLRAGLLPEPHRAEARKELRDYVDIRVDLVAHPEQLRQTLARSEALHERLWSHATAVAQLGPQSPIHALFVAALNDVIDLHTKRVTVGMYYRPPGIIWAVLYFVAILSMASVGYQFGLAGTRSSTVNLGLALTFSAVLYLIGDLDRGAEGSIRVNQRPMVELQQQLHRSVQ